jgi:hypothetical protein
VLNEDDEEDENDYNERYDSEAEEEDDDDDDNGTIARFLSASVLLLFSFSLSIRKLTRVRCYRQQSRRSRPAPKRTKAKTWRAHKERTRA